MRHAIDISPNVFRASPALRERQGGSLDAIASGLPAEALDGRREEEGRAPTLEWRSQPMGARVDLADKDALCAILDDPPS